MKKLLLPLMVFLFTIPGQAQTVHQVCISEVYSAGACNSTTGVFTPGDLVINVGDQIEFTTYMILLGGYNGIHDIQFAGSPANNVMLPISTDVLNPITTVTTPPFMTPGVYSMQCMDSNHCTFAELLEGWTCNTYTVTVLSSCTTVADFSSSTLSICEGETVSFTNSSVDATVFDWKVDEVSFSAATDTSFTFNTPGSYDVELVASDGSGCDDSMSVTVDVQAGVDAGSDGTLTLCNTAEDSVDVNTLLSGADAGGVWMESTGSGQFDAGTGYFNPAGIAAGNYVFNYSLTGTTPCPDDDADMTITIGEFPQVTIIPSTTNLAVTDSVYIDFTTIDVLPGATYLWEFCDGNTGNSSTPFYYSWPSPGNYCICLTIDNNNGCSEQYCITDITVFDNSGLNAEGMEDIHIYPNPADDFFTIESYNSDSELLNGEIRDQTGRVVKSWQFQAKSTEQVDISTLQAGVYWVQISNDKDGRLIQPLLIK